MHAIGEATRSTLVRNSADEAPQALEGAWPTDKIVLIRFPDEAAFREWENSEAYQRIAVDRIAGAETASLLLRGLAEGPNIDIRPKQ